MCCKQSPLIVTIVFIFFTLVLAACAGQSQIPTLVATNTSPPPRPTATLAPTPTATTKVLTFFIAGGDKGRSGKAVGCNDSIVPVEWEIHPTNRPIKPALEKLFSFKEQFVGPMGLYNALYQSNLQVQKVTLEQNGNAVVHLVGDTLIGGVCDTPRYKAQLVETIVQFPNVATAEVYINGVALEDFLSQK